MLSVNGRSFSFIDGVVLVASVLTVYELFRLTQVYENAKPVLIREWPGNATPVGLIVASICLGIACAGPFVMATQFLIRGRSSGLSLGEWLWAVPLTIYITGIISNQAMSHVSDHAALLTAVACALLQWIASLTSIWALAAPRSGSGHWSDRMGCFACMLAGLYLAYNILRILLRFDMSLAGAASRCLSRPGRPRDYSLGAG